MKQANWKETAVWVAIAGGVLYLMDPGFSWWKFLQSFLITQGLFLTYDQIKEDIQMYKNKNGSANTNS